MGHSNYLQTLFRVGILTTGLAFATATVRYVACSGPYRSVALDAGTLNDATMDTFRQESLEQRLDAGVYNKDSQ